MAKGRPKESGQYYERAKRSIDVAQEELQCMLDGPIGEQTPFRVEQLIGYLCDAVNDLTQAQRMWLEDLVR